MTDALQGGCLCGALRYRLDGAPANVIDAGYCHCRLCQRSSGAPVLAWLTLAFDALRYTRGAPAVFRSSTHSQREFCAICGTQIAFRRISAPRTVDVTLASLDDPSTVSPQYHIWYRSRLPWLEIADPFPRHEDAGPDAHDVC